MRDDQLASGDSGLVVPTGRDRDRAFAEIIIPLALPKTYTWLVPPQLLDTVRPGCRVEVNLGKNKKYAGVVKKLHSENPGFIEPKETLNRSCLNSNLIFGSGWLVIICAAREK